MFTGIIEAQSKIIEVTPGDSSLQILVERPAFFDDLKIGDSIAHNGVCLTLEKMNEKTMSFTIGHETLLITGWSKESLSDATMNLERSLRFGDRVHGHLVSGHVDTVTEVVEKSWAGDCLLLSFAIPSSQSPLIWKKSSVALNGVSLTVNDVEDGKLQVCLIPETLSKTNLQQLQVGEKVNIETDYYMKGFLSSQGEINAQRP